MKIFLMFYMCHFSMGLTHCYKTTVFFTFYYVNNGNSVYCTFLDASKAFDRVEYSKLFRLLIKRQIPAVILRMLCNMYVSHVTCVDWNGVHSSVFSVINGVKQRGIISPILFCIYIDDLLSSHTKACFSH